MVAAVAPKQGRSAVDLVQRLRIRSLYCTQGLPPKDIATQTGVPIRTVNCLIYRQGWTEVRRRTERQIAANADARTAAEVESITEGVAIKSEELGIASLNKAGDVLENERGEYWAKDVQSLSQAAKNFIGLARQARGLDQANEATSGANLVFVSLDRIQDRPEKVVTEIHELDTAEVAPINTPKADAIYKSVPAIVLESDDDGAF